MSAPAKAKALEALIEAHATELKLPTLRQRFRALAAATASSGPRSPTSPRCSTPSTRSAPSGASEEG